jgi:hypothetical protein
MEVSGQRNAPASLLQRKETPVPMDRRLGGHQIRSGRCGQEENISPARIPNPTVRPVARRY